MNIQKIKENRKKPNFLRQDAHKVKSLKKIWRKPKGMHNKMRWGIKGQRRCPAIGYKLDERFRGLSNGAKGVLVFSVNDLSKIKEGEGIILSSKIGMKNRLRMLEEIKKLKLKCLNLDIDKTLESINEELKKRKEAKKGAAKTEEKKPSEETFKKSFNKNEGKTEEKKEVKVEKKETNKESPKKEEKKTEDKKEKKVK